MKAVTKYIFVSANRIIKKARFTVIINSVSPTPCCDEFARKCVRRRIRDRTGRGELNPAPQSRRPRVPVSGIRRLCVLAITGSTTPKLKAAGFPIDSFGKDKELDQYRHDGSFGSCPKGPVLN